MYYVDSDKKRLNKTQDKYIIVCKKNKKNKVNYKHRLHKTKATNRIFFKNSHVLHNSGKKYCMYTNLIHTYKIQPK